MTGPGWMIVLKIKPLDPEAAEQEARWLRLGDDALANHHSQEVENREMAPGRRALRELERATHDSQEALEKYREEKRRFFDVFGAHEHRLGRRH
jgi:hypothetical protein